MALLVLTLLLPAALAGQAGWWPGSKPFVEEMGAYAAGAGAHLVEMSFASHSVRNREACADLKGMAFGAVDLVFTRYPMRLEDWEINYDTLMARRLATLMALAPGAFGEEVAWRIVLQTDCGSLEEARGMFHGFVLYEKAALELGEDEMDSLELPEPRYTEAELGEGLERALGYFDGLKPYYDSTALEVFARHPDWRDAALVVDWTASMYGHGGQLLHWLGKEEAGGRVLGYVLFNDGDGKWDQEKVVGATGGLYLAEAGRPDSLRAAVVRATLGGSGGDHRENDLEAVLAALEAFPEAREIVLLADNGGPVRDLALLGEIDRPVRVLLTGVYKESYQPDYFTIAYHSGGSVHTREADYPNTADLLEHGRFVLGKYTYELKGKRFVRKEEN